MKQLFEQILAILSTIEYDLATALLALCLLLFAMFCNQVLGAVMASTCGQFDSKRLGKSIIKGMLIAVAVSLFCIVLDVFPVLLERVDVISKDFKASKIVTVLEVLSILVIAIMKYCKEIYEKLLTLFEVNKEEVDNLVDPQNYVAEKEVV